MNINKNWKRFLAFGCTHAKAIDKEAWDFALGFRERFKPHMVLHLGDAIDMAGLMGHGKGTDTEGDELNPDIDTGLTQLRELKPNVWIYGNHEDRAFKLARSKHAATAYAAEKICQEMEKCAEKIRCQTIKYSGIYQVYDLADIAFQHGVLFNEMAARDTCEYLCTNGVRRKAVFVHTHKTAIQAARNLTSAIGYNVGTLTKRGSLDYAKNRRATLAWTQAICWGYYQEETKQSAIYITQRNHDEVWVSPI
jgi:hypothetical protein